MQSVKPKIWVSIALKSLSVRYTFYVLCLILGLGVAPSARACLNEDEMPLPGVSIDGYEAFRLHRKEIDVAALRGFLRELDSCKTRLSPDCSDLVVVYLYLQALDSAHIWSKRLLAKFPDEYNVVINHAVVLELQGKPAEALVYLKKALVINPDSHFGSEWIHRRILENYIAGNTAPERSILGLDFGTDSLPARPDSLTTVDVMDLIAELRYQLEDRLFFLEQDGTHQKDPLYGSLLYDYANLLLLQGHVEPAYDYFTMAREYGFNSPLLSARTDVAFERMIALQNAEQQKVLREERRITRRKDLRFFAFTSLGLVAALVLVFVVRYKTRKLR